MIPARIANSVRVALPYASWVGYAIQLGYVGYNLYQYYQYYLAQVERDRRNGCDRSLNDTIELVIKPRRKRKVTQEADPNAEQQQLNSDASQEIENQEIKQDHPSQDSGAIVSDKQAVNASSTNVPQEANHATAPAAGEQEDDDEVACVYDSRAVDANLGPSTSGLGKEPDAVEDEDALSTTSLSLESTDSNKGIIHDIYAECFICARGLNDAEKPVTTLPFCMHPFHKSCLDGVLKWHMKCPICDSNIFTPI